jgi:hypothetical protein
VYHELVAVPRELGRRAAAFGLAWTIAGCGDAHWATLRWPNTQPDAPAQPTAEARAIALALRATKIHYEPEAILVTLELENRGELELAIERAAIMLAWDGLEYANEAGEPAWVELPAQSLAELELRYVLGRPLRTGGAQIVVRSVRRAGVTVVELPTLELPGMS